MQPACWTWYLAAPSPGTLSWQAESWFAAVEGVFAARQAEVSAINRETPTPGYEILNLYAGWQPSPGIRLVAGVDNLTDALYRDHLSGVNRVAGSGVALGARLPDPGRSFYARLALRWGADLE